MSDLDELLSSFYYETLTKDENKQLINMLIQEVDKGEELADDLKEAFDIEEKENQVQACIDWVWEMRAQIDEWMS